MMGFISALSSALAIIILIFCTFLLTNISNSLPRSRNISKIEENKYRLFIGEVAATKHELTKVIGFLEANKYALKKMEAGCMYKTQSEKNNVQHVVLYNIVYAEHVKWHGTELSIDDEPLIIEGPEMRCFYDVTVGEDSDG